MIDAVGVDVVRAPFGFGARHLLIERDRPVDAREGIVDVAFSGAGLRGPPWEPKPFASAP